MCAYVCALIGLVLLLFEKRRHVLDCLHEAGVPAPLPNFGTMLVLGKKYMIRKSLS